ncbi:hypothetical protein LTR97_011436 [Elasticomyces elasticus]|uniref:Uncharacterized protein n=1 Tax=Elasticomyces elasticus TaxID=574655 RepID=A0AAN7ZYJ9_9PEZI|nr:hypothetical protein LTR97_011436 [Elasticomyces elasticus]
MDEPLPPPPPYSPRPPPPPQPPTPQLRISGTMIHTIKTVVQAELFNPRYRSYPLDRTAHLRHLLLQILMIDYGVWSPRPLSLATRTSAYFLARQIEALGCPSGPRDAKTTLFVQEHLALPAAELGLPLDVVCTMLIRYSANLRMKKSDGVTYTGCLAAVFVKRGEAGLLEKCQRDLDKVVDVIVPSGDNRVRLRRKIEGLIADREAWHGPPLVREGSG